MEDALRVRLQRLAKFADTTGYRDRTEVERPESQDASPQQEHDRDDHLATGATSNQKELHECFELLRDYDGESRIATELLVLCAETALKHNALEVADQSAELSFIRSQVHDQFFCRAKFVKALIEHKRGELQSGADLLKHALRAVEHINAAVQVCLEPSRINNYGFLVFNASVVAWQVMRPVMRKGCRKHTLQVLTRLCDALNVLDDPHKAWRARLSLALALAHHEEGAAAPALSEAKRALELIVDESPTSDIVRETNAFYVHIQQQGAVAVAKTARSQGDVQPLLQCIRSGIISDKASIQMELQEALKVTMPNSQEDASGESNKQHASTSVISIGRAALRSHLYALSEECMVAAASIPSRFLSAVEEVDLDLFRAEWLAECPGALPEIASTGTKPAEDNVKNVSQTSERAINLAKRIQAMRLLDRCISFCLRLHQPALLEEACLVTWNISLPLLQPHLRTHVHKAFQTAANALEEVDSPLLELRAHLHSEVSKCEMAADFLTRANQQVEKAMRLHQSSQAMGGNVVREDRSQNPDLSRFLKPMHEKLKLKSSIYSEPDSPLEQAILQVEQAKDANERHLKASLLTRAAEFLDIAAEDFLLLQAHQQQQQHQQKGQLSASEGGQKDKFHLPSQIIVDSVNLWAEIAQLASEQRLLDITERAANHVFACESFPEGQDVDRKSWYLQRARTHFVFADALARRIQKMQVHEQVPLVTNIHVRALGIIVPAPIESADYDGTLESELTNEDSLSNQSIKNITSASELTFEWPSWEAPPFPDLLTTYKDDVITHLIKALQIGSELGEGWLIENAATYLWNYHLHMFNGPLQRLQFVTDALLDGLKTALEALQDLDTSERNGTLFCALSCALAQGFEGRAIRTKVIGSSDSLTKPEDDLQSAVEICQQAMQGYSPRITKEIIATLQRVQRRRKVPQNLPEDQLAAGFAVIELLRLEFDLVPQDEKLKLLGAYYERIRNITSPLVELENPDRPIHVEIWSRLARQAFQINQTDIAEKCSQAVLGSQDGKGSTTDTPQELWRWFSICETVRGQVAAKRAFAVTHDKTTQDDLRKESLRHLSTAAEYGVRSKNSILVLDAAKELWNVATELVGSTGTRSILFRPLRAMLQYLLAVREKSDMALRVNMYAALFECYKDMKDWKGGLKVVDEAFSIIPQSLQKRLWAARVIFNSKLNKDVAAGLHKMKEGNNSLQAKAWMTLAMSSANQEDQLQAFVQALNLLEGSYERVDYLIEFAEWLHANHFSRDDVTQCLVSAADQILDVEIAAEKRAQAAAETRAKNAMSPKSPSSQMSAITRRTARSASPKRNPKVPRELGDPCGDAPRDLRLGDYLKLVQIFVMLARSVPHSKIRADMALVAHEHLATAWTRFIAPGHACELKQLVSESSRKSIPIEVASTIERPSLTVHYLLELGLLLQECGQQALSITCFVVMECICVDVLQDKTFATLSGLKMVRTLSVINLGAVAREKMNGINISLNEADRVRFGVEVEQLLERQHILGNSNSQQSMTSAHDADHVPSNMPVKKDAANEVITKSGVQPTQRRVLGPMKIREVWARLASELIDLGYIFEGKVFLHEVGLHNLAYDDKENRFRAKAVEAKIALIEGKESSALARAVEAMEALSEHRGGNVTDWLHCIQEVTACLQHSSRNAEARKLLQKALVVYNAKLKSMGTLKDLDLEVATSYIETLVAEHLFGEVRERAQQGAIWQDEWVQCQFHLRNAQDRVLIATKPQCASIATMDILLRHCGLWMEVYKTRAMRQEQVAFANIVDGLCRASRSGEAMLQMVLPTSEIFCADVKGVNLPLERYVGRVHYMLGNIELLHDAYCNPLPAVSSAAREAERVEQLNPAERWLLQTAPVPPPSLADLHPSAVQRACSHFMSAYKHLQHIPVQSAAALVAAGQGLCRNQDQRGEELLQNGCQLALKQRDYDLAKVAAHELVLAFHSFDALLLYQACRFRTWMSQLVESAALDSEGKLSQFIRLRTHIQKHLFSPDELGDTHQEDSKATEHKIHWPYAEIRKYLQQSVQLNRLSCHTTIPNMIKTLPSGLDFIVISLSENGRIIYTTQFSKEEYIDGDDTNNEKGHTKPEVFQFPLEEFDAQDLHVLLQDMTTCRKRMSSQLLSRTHDPQFDENSCELEDKAAEDISVLIRRMKKLLLPALPSTIRASRFDGTEGASDLRKSDSSSSSQVMRRLVVLADPELSRLPLELLFQDKSQYLSVSRDLSLHMFHHRLQAVTPGLTDAMATSQVIEPAVAPRSASVRYVIDSRSEESLLTADFSAGSAWEGFMGPKQGMPSRGDWQVLLGGKPVAAEQAQFIFCGLGAFFAQVQPGALAAVDMRKRSTAILLDRAVNDASYRFQSEHEAKLTSIELQLEQPVETAALLSICGVNSIVQHQWACSVHRAHQMLQRMSNLLKQAPNSSQLIVDALHTPEDIQLKERVRANAVFYGVPLM